MENFRKISVSKRIAMVAHDNRKVELLDWANSNREQLAKNKLYATGTGFLWVAINAYLALLSYSRSVIQKRFTLGKRPASSDGR